MDELLTTEPVQASTLLLIRSTFDKYRRRVFLFWNGLLEGNCGHLTVYLERYFSGRLLALDLEHCLIGELLSDLCFTNFDQFLGMLYTD